MKISENWLREWVDPPVATNELCDQLTSVGLEVQGADRLLVAPLDVRVAEVMSIEPHHAARNLKVCTVDDGNGAHRVVCGAGNVRVGMRTAYAGPGTKLPDGTVLATREIRGVVSEGMLCSAQELGLWTSAGSILDLGRDARVGESVQEALRLDDRILTLDLTPNRGDCFSLLGVSRELGVLNDLDVTLPRQRAFSLESDASKRIQLGSPSACPRYLGRVIEGVDISNPTPVWLLDRLHRAGLRPINPIVDVTNYVMIELGQPLHAFDLDALKEDVCVRTSEVGESLRLLDGEEPDLQVQDLLICDASGPVALAGIMGGERSAVTGSTVGLFLECAYFDPMTIAQTSRRLGLQTDASTRYERGVDFNLQHRAEQRATELLLHVVGGRAGPLIEAVDHSRLPSRKQILLRRNRLRQLVGGDVAPSLVQRTFRRLEFSPEAREVGWLVTPPSHRFDIEIEEDLVEEVCRIAGFDSIASRTPKSAPALKRVDKNCRGKHDLRRQFCGLGFQEAMTYSFVAAEDNELLDPGARLPHLSNPMASERSHMRSTLWPGLIGAARTNIARQAAEVRLFEIGQCFRIQGGHLVQSERAGAVVWGARNPKLWGHSADVADFYDLKGDIEALTETTHADWSFSRIQNRSLHPGQSAGLFLEGVQVGRLGRIHPRVASVLDVPPNVLLFESDLEPLLRLKDRRNVEISRFPSVRRDLACLVKKDVEASRLEAIVRTALGDFLYELAVFDVYSDGSMQDDLRSVALSLTMQHTDDTLTESVINELMDRVRSRLSSEAHATFR